MGRNFRQRVQVTFFLDEAAKRAVESLAAVHDVRKADAYRRVVDLGLASIKADPDVWSAAPTLTPKPQKET